MRPSADLAHPRQPSPSLDRLQRFVSDSDDNIDGAHNTPLYAAIVVRGSNYPQDTIRN